MMGTGHITGYGVLCECAPTHRDPSRPVNLAFFFPALKAVDNLCGGHCSGFVPARPDDGAGPSYRPLRLI